MSHSEREYLEHMLAEVEFLLADISHHAKGEFLASEIMKRAAVRSLEIIGEAAKKISADFRTTHQDIPWSLMAGMRDRLIHAYFGVDYDIVWDVIQSKLAPLKSQLCELIEIYPP